MVLRQNLDVFPLYVLKFLHFLLLLFPVPLGLTHQEDVELYHQIFDRVVLLGELYLQLLHQIFQKQLPLIGHGLEVFFDELSFVFCCLGTLPELLVLHDERFDGLFHVLGRWFFQLLVFDYKSFYPIGTVDFTVSPDCISLFEIPELLLQQSVLALAICIWKW